MTTSTNSRQGAARTAAGGMGNASRRAWIEGGLITGATLLVLNGLFHIFVAIAGFARTNYYTTASNYPYNLSSTGWAWVHVIAGVVLALTGFALLTGSRLARAMALVFLGLSALANFFFIPFQPFWALLIIAIDVFAIWAIANARGRGSLSGEQPQMGARQAAMMQGQQYQGAYQPAGAQGAMAGAGYQQSAYQGEQRWPENVQGRAAEGRRYAAENVKAPESPRSAEQARDQAREQASQSSSGLRETGEQAADRARQSGRGNYQGR